MPAPSKPRKSKASLPSGIVETSSQQDRQPPMTSTEAAICKAMYLKKGARPAEIAAKLGRPKELVQQWVWKLGLPKAKAELAKKLEEAAMAKVENEALQQLAEWKPQCAELSDDMLDLARSEVINESPYRAKNLANLASAFKTFSGCYGQFAGVSSIQGNGGNITVNMLYAPVAPAKPVEPAMDI